MTRMISPKKKVILLHGNGGGTGADNWLPDIRSSLSELGVECVTPDMPDAELGRASVWLPYLHDELKVDEHTIIVGHSTGAIAAMRYAEKHKLLGSVLVGGYYTDLGDENEKQSGYFDIPWDWTAIKQHQDWIEVFASTDDPWIPIEEPRFVRDHLTATYHEFNDKGHFGYDTEMKEFPELLTALKNRLSS